MKSKLVRIGNSRGIRIPKLLLEKAGLEGEVEIDVEGNRLVVRSVHQPRAGWEEAFRRMSRAGDDALIDPETPGLSRWDDEEWEW